MRDLPHELRGPWDVPDELRVDGTGGIDTDGDGVADTVVDGDGFDLLVATDLDGDGVADQVLRVAADATVHPTQPPDIGGDMPG